MSEPTPADPSSDALVASQSDSTLSKASKADATMLENQSLLADTTIATTTTTKDSSGGSQDTAVDSQSPQGRPAIDQSNGGSSNNNNNINTISALPSQPSIVDTTPDSTGAGSSGALLAARDPSEEFVVMETGTTATAVGRSVSGSASPTSTVSQAAPTTSITTSVDGATTEDLDDGKPVQQQTKVLIAAPWQDILIGMLSELGFIESSRMVAAEELVLSAAQKKGAPGIIQKFSRLLQESTLESWISVTNSTSGSSKRQNADSSDLDTDTLDSIKRRRVDDVHSMIQENASRAEIGDRMVQFMAAKRDQINESNRQEFIGGRGQTAYDSADPLSADDDGCARVDARKLNRTIQMKLETVKNEALTKTNPRTHAPANDVSLASSGLDERLRNIQIHLNLRIAAVPACTIAERIRIVEDVIIQLERDYPLWSALHFNQPNRMFPPPPSVTTVSRNSRNQIVLTGDHLRTTLIETGDPTVDATASAQYPQFGVSRSVSAGQSANTQRQRVADENGRAGSTPTGVIDGVGAALAGPGKPAVSSPAGPGGSATVIKLKRHGGAGSSSLARAVQQQLAQRKANAAGGGLATDESRNALGNGSTPTFRIASTSYLAADTLSKSTSSIHASREGSSPGGSLSPTVDFSDPLTAGVTGRGPIKSRRKSIAKGLDPASAMASMSVAHASNILGSNPETALAGNASNHQNAHFSALSEGSLGSFNVSKSKPATTKKPRKKKGENNGEDASASTPGSRAGAGRGKGGFGMGKGKGGGRPMGFGLGKGKGGAYRQELLRRAEVEEFDEDSDDDLEDDFDADNTGTASLTGVAANSGNGALDAGNNATFLNDNSALAHLVSSALKEQARLGQQQQQQQMDLQQLGRSQQQSSGTPKSKKQPRKASTPAKPPVVRKFGGKSFGMAGGESSGSSSNDSSDGEGSGSSDSQSDSSSSGASGRDGEDSD
ncbi:hypothetical protein BGZ98_002025 [Dissophora globulifera]|nr:hypothetical protein BGZ98_002025 [Dissophora globulifera]